MIPSYQKLHSALTLKLKKKKRKNRIKVEKLSTCIIQGWEICESPKESGTIDVHINEDKEKI